MTTAIELPNKAYMLPDTIPNWPPVWWFWLVLATVIVMFGLTVISIRRRYIKQAYRREALKQLNDQQDLSDQALTEHCLTLIKRCLITEGKTELASLTTKALLPLLDQQVKRAPIKLTQCEDSFSTSLYQPNGQLTPAQRAALIQATRHWIRRHHA